MSSSPPTGDAASFAELADILLLRSGINATNVILGATLLGCAAGLVGTFAILRKRALMTDALAHATLPGICAAFLIADAMGLTAKSLPLLLLGGGITGILGVLTVQAITQYTRVRQDAAIGLVLSVFFGCGVVLLLAIPIVTTTPAGGLNGFIYGQAAAIRRSEVLLIGIVGAGAAAATLAMLKPFSLVCFNDQFAQSLGWPVRRIDLGIMALIVLVTMAGLQAVGLIMIVALLIIPPAAARFWTDRLPRMLAISGGLGALSGYSGAALSAALPNKPAGAVTVLCAGALFASSLLLAPKRGVVAELVRRARLQLLVAGEHMLESLHDSRGGSVSTRGLAAARGLPIARTRVILQLLALRRLVSKAAGGWSLTRSGQVEGARIARNHSLWAEYLISRADIAPSHVDWSVDQVEHVLGDDLVAELERSMASRGHERARR